MRKDTDVVRVSNDGYRMSEKKKQILHMVDY